jgi:tRNA(adenine34) deaminase
MPANLSRLRPRINMQHAHFDSLMALEKIATQNGDFPIGALLVYKDRIIGTGFNTVKNRDEPLGHAELNAIEDMFQAMDLAEFRTLDRDSLILFVSFEPCMMCKGTINHFEIRKIYFLNSKKVRYRLKYLRLDFSFFLKMRRIKVPEVQ